MIKAELTSTGNQQYGTQPSTWQFRLRIADGVVTASVLRPQGPPEVLYSFDPEGTVGVGGARGAWSFDPSVTSVTVTATLRSPNINAWSALSDGWGRRSRVT